MFYGVIVRASAVGSTGYTYLALFSTSSMPFPKTITLRYYPHHPQPKGVNTYLKFKLPRPWFYTEGVNSLKM